MSANGSRATGASFNSGGQAAADLVGAARSAARQGNREKAGRLLQQAVGQNPASAEAWLGLAWLATDLRERELLLRRVLLLDPQNEKALVELARLQGGGTSSKAGARPQKDRLSRWAWGLVAVVAVGLAVVLLAWSPVSRGLASVLFTPTPTASPTATPSPGEMAARFIPKLQAALQEEGWSRALEITAIMQSLDPSGAETQHWAWYAHMQYGRSLVQAEKPQQALGQFEAALGIAPDDVETQLWLGTTQAYLAGRDAYDAGQWAAAIQSLTLVQEKIPDYGNAFPLLVEAYRRLAQAAVDKKDWTTVVNSLSQASGRVMAAPGMTDMLLQAYRQRGIEFEAQKKLQEARKDLEAALALAPGDAEAKAHLDAVMYKLFPPKRIEINISEQRMYVYEGDNLIHKYVISTGLPGRDTAAGHFKVLDKIPMAYSSIWRLKMPNWLGIYYVGGVENGIHALPIRPDGSVMWGGLLGTKQSYGCVILNNQAARELYDWAEIGTKVDIHY